MPAPRRLPPNHLTIRNVSPALARALGEEKVRRATSLNQTVLQLLEQALAVGPGAEYDNGLGALAGGWTDEDLASFEASVAVFEEIDEGDWR